MAGGGQGGSGAGRGVWYVCSKSGAAVAMRLMTSTFVGVQGGAGLGVGKIVIGDVSIFSSRLDVGCAGNWMWG